MRGQFDCESNQLEKLFIEPTKAPQGVCGEDSGKVVQSAKGLSVDRRKKKINNCIAKQSKFFIRDNERRVRKGKDKIFILVKES